jgi:hypothetical protein
MPELADIFRRYGAAYLQQFDHTLLPSHRRAIEDILDCRTEARGGHVYVCDHCGRSQYAYHSCRNRSCPKCHQQQTEAWLQARRAELLPVAYFHVVFTVPQELRRCLRGHQKTLYGILMQAAAGSLIKLAADPHYVGGLIGVLATLQTWTRTLAYHPHVHCLVPAGGVCADRRTWLDARATYLVPERALSRIFRGLFSELVARRAPQLRLPDAIWHTDWVVYCKPTIQGTQRVLDYLGRYVHRVAITNRRIVSIDDGHRRGVHPSFPSARAPQALPQGPLLWPLEPDPSAPAAAGAVAAPVRQGRARRCPSILLPGSRGAPDRQRTNYPSHDVPALWGRHPGVVGTPSPSAEGSSMTPSPSPCTLRSPARSAHRNRHLCGTAALRPRPEIDPAFTGLAPPVLASAASHAPSLPPRTLCPTPSKRYNAFVETPSRR